MFDMKCFVLVLSLKLCTVYCVGSRQDHNVTLFRLTLIMLILQCSEFYV